MLKMQQKPKKSIFNRLVRCQKFKIISIRLEIRNQHVEMHQIPSMEEKSATSSAKPVSLPYHTGWGSIIGNAVHGYITCKCDDISIN